MLPYVTANGVCQIRGTELVHKPCTPADKDAPTGVQMNKSDTALHLYLN